MIDVGLLCCVVKELLGASKARSDELLENAVLRLELLSSGLLLAAAATGRVQRGLGLCWSRRNRGAKARSRLAPATVGVQNGLLAVNGRTTTRLETFNRARNKRH